MNEATIKNYGKASILGAGGCLLLVAVTLGAAFWVSSNLEPVKRSPPPKTHSASDALTACRSLALQRLKAPATARFERGNSSDLAEEVLPGRYEVRSYVDAQNSFGALIRTRFVCEVQWRGGDRYDLVRLDM